MITKNNLPEGFTPYPSLVVCSNTISGGGHVVAAGEILPLLVGKGDKPKIWLQAVEDAKEKRFITIVEASVSQHARVKVYEDEDHLKILVSGDLILSVKSSDSEQAIIDQLDFRPIGLNMQGDSSGLSVGGSVFSGNAMHGGGAFIGLGG
ncbi:hypothetical protein QWY74_00215 [Halomonas almeriensis]|uniref:hypothetical protein n=1 Tax=Halomonas almeriensis TaxID=308163 RepID=UPI0025B3FD5B|nr:hypothetical protein [Halomonas almeriensis]MDN3551905.1 hypothetical protein [Halomonas almeriensis]